MWTSPLETDLSSNGDFYFRRRRSIAIQVHNTMDLFDFEQSITITPAYYELGSNTNLNRENRIRHMQTCIKILSLVENQSLPRIHNYTLLGREFQYVCSNSPAHRTHRKTPRSQRARRKYNFLLFKLKLIKMYSVKEIIPKYSNEIKKTMNATF